MVRKTPRGVGFCWDCGRKLYGNHFATDKNPDGNEVVLHKQCKKDRYGQVPGKDKGRFKEFPWGRGEEEE